MCYLNLGLESKDSMSVYVIALCLGLTLNMVEYQTPQPEFGFGSLLSAAYVFLELGAFPLHQDMWAFPKLKISKWVAF